VHTFFIYTTVLLPASALDELARMNIVWPIMFKVSNPKDPSLYTHCGVLEFSAEEGRAYVPLWVREHSCFQPCFLVVFVLFLTQHMYYVFCDEQQIQDKLKLKPGQIINVQNANLPKGTFVKIRPQQKAFIELIDPKAV